MTEMMKTKSLARRLLGKLIPLLIILAAIAAVLVIYKRQVEETPPEVVPPEPVNVVVERITVIPALPDEFVLNATVEPNRVVNVAAEVEGRIERYGQNNGSQLQEGDSIKAGAPLMYLNTDLLQATYNKSEAQYEYNLRHYNRIEEARQRNVATQKELDEASTNLALSKAALDEVKAKLDRTTIFAPAGGVVNRIPVEVGEFVQPGTICAKIVDNETVKVVVNISEQDIGYFKVGQEQKVFVNHNGQDITLTCPITYTSQEAEPSAHTTRVEISAPNADGIFHSGKVVTVRLKRRDLKNVITVPLDAIIPLEDGHMAYVVEDGKAQPRKDIQIDLLSIKGKRIRVLSGLADGEQLIVKGNWMCAPGQKVRIVSEEPGKESVQASALTKQQGN